jgi:hypothetical protein
MLRVNTNLILKFPALGTMFVMKACKSFNLICIEQLYKWIKRKTIRVEPDVPEIGSMPARIGSSIVLVLTSSPALRIQLPGTACSCLNVIAEHTQRLSLLNDITVPRGSCN